MTKSKPARTAFQVVLMFWVAAVVAFAQPVISTPVNGASFIPPGLPLYGIAQGSMFAVFGLRIGPDELVVVSAFPVPTELAGTSAQVTVGGVTVDCLMIFTSAGQIAAILPSSTPIGEGTMTLTFNGERSNSARILVVENAAGMFALRQDGRGPGIFTDPSFAPNTITNAFAPGTIAIAWLTGLGARSSDDRPVPQDLKEELGLQVKDWRARSESTLRGALRLLRGSRSGSLRDPEAGTGGLLCSGRDANPRVG